MYVQLESGSSIPYKEFIPYFRWVARDIGGSDPERMTPIKVEEYVRSAFESSPLKIEVISDLSTLQKDFPLFAAVNRAANGTS